MTLDVVSFNVVFNKSLFETLEMFEGSGREITFGDKGVLVAKGSGSIKLRCETPTGESLVTLQNVSTSPGSRRTWFRLARQLRPEQRRCS